MPRLMFQRTDDPRPSKVSQHLDLHVPTVADLAGAVDRAVVLGAVHVTDQEQHGIRWAVMADPEGNPFCLVPDGP